MPIDKYYSKEAIGERIQQRLKPKQRVGQSIIEKLRGLRQQPKAPVLKGR